MPSVYPGYNWRTSGISAPLQHIRIDDVGGRPGSISNNLIEDISELELIFLPRHVAYVWRGNDVVYRKQGMVQVGDGLLFIHIDGRATWPPGSQRGNQRAGRDQQIGRASCRERV